MNTAEKLDTPDYITQIEQSANLASLDDVRIAILGKKGELTTALKELGQVAPELRRERGQELNKQRKAVEAAIDARKASLEADAEATQLANERVDVTLPIKETVRGTIHPITQVMDEIATIFAGMGFEVRHGPLVEDDEHNFDALNIPPSHPARQMHDTFYVRETTADALQNENEKSGEHSHVLRTHTSPVQVRTMKNEEPPIRIIAPGSTFRSDSDMTHTPMFHQVEGLLIDKNINMGHLKGCLIQFLREFFGKDELPVRFRPSFFPFTEPSAEVDIGCKKSKEALFIGEGDDWMEILGCGMVHPNVLTNCGLDPDEWQGFAFGMGVERLAMLKYNIPDLRTFFDGDQRWMKHYGFSSMNIPGVFGESNFEGV